MLCINKILFFIICSASIQKAAGWPHISIRLATMTDYAMHMVNTIQLYTSKHVSHTSYR